MATQINDDSLCKKYGIPIYGASWVPTQKILNQKPIEEKEQVEKEDQELEKESTQSISLLVFGGGGGEGRSGIPNALFTTQFDFTSNSLSPDPVFKLEMKAELPYRLAVHPGGEGLICSLPKSCRWFEWEMLENNLALRSSEKRLTELEDIGQQLALTFSSSGSLLAVGGEDGCLKVLEWPSMKVILDQADAHTTVKDLDFSPDGKFLVSLGGRGPCRVWDVTTLKIVASLSKQNDEMFGFCNFSYTTDGSQILYTTSSGGKGGSIISWSSTSWKRIGSKQISRDAISAFSVSGNGRLLAVGTVQGDILILNSVNMRVQKMVKKAHLGIPTALSFSQDSRYLVSASMDSSARVTRIEDTNMNRSNLWMIVLVLILAILVYFAKEPFLAVVFNRDF
ncbi:hypothetical protein GIB67_010897 [Kingdonia uniflora]|uniref:SEC12-like protein 2 n=1 Tax=Kingdonia uniflora TaxID=39325 RepID=A0A7J7M4N0_9MAGN|nr:hypothetical protein GIB67_010897 [Kingdonia uniflora]